MDDDVVREERAVYLIVAVACAPVLLGSAIAGVLDGGTMLCALLATGGVIGLLQSRGPGVWPLARLMPRSRKLAGRPS